jgi:hypothetical protein
MKQLTSSSVCALLLGTLVLFACNDDDDGGDGNGAGSGNLPGAVLANQPNVPGALGPENVPLPGARIDRAGRVAITAALVEAFNPDVAAQNAAHDRYNASGNGNPEFIPTIEASLGILDSLDNQCGTQLLYGAGPDPARPYQAFATALDDDQLYLNSGAARPASVYLGVEGEATGALEPGQGNAGGRVPGDDVVARSYSVLALGALRGIDDGVPSDDATHDPNTFPFIAPPQ